jgi:hypothetical protein
MPVETPSLFTQVIQDHLELKRRNAELDKTMPIDRYKLEDTFSNHPLFKSEEQARLEETMDGTDQQVEALPTVLRWPGEESGEVAPAPAAQPAAPQAPAPAADDDSGLWGRSRDFDWGDN